MPGKTVSPRLKEIEDNFVKNGGSFKEFRIGELFEIQKITSRLSQLNIKDGTHIPVYSSDTTNGGIYGYTDKAEFHITEKCQCYLLFGDHTRTFNIARCDFAVMDNVKVLKPAGHFSDELLMYIVTVWKKQIPNYGYSRHWKYASKCVLKLPVDNNNLAFDYMENFIRELEMERIRELEMERIRELDAYLKVTGLNDTELTDDEKDCLEKFEKGEVCFNEFKIGELFYKQNLKCRKNKFDKRKDVSTVRNREFCLPLVNAKDGNNGIMYYGRPEDWDVAEFCIDIINDGAVSTGNAYPQPQKTGVLYNAYLIRGIKKDFHNELVIIYLSQVLQKSIKEKYGYDNKATWDKVKDNFISLPVQNGYIAFTAMETFIRALEKSCIRSAVEWKDKIIETTKRIVDANAPSNA